MLIDTGANKSFIDPQFLNRNNLISIPQIQVRTLFRTHSVTEKVILNGLIEFKVNQPLDFYSFKFHDYFNGLIGLETIQQLGIKLDFKNSLLETDKVKIPLLFKPNQISKNFLVPPRTKFKIQVPVDKQLGDFYIKPIEVAPQLIIPEGIYNSSNWYANMEIINFSHKSQNCSFEQPIQVEAISNYTIEINHSNISALPNTANISNLIRTNHLNSEEKLAIHTLCEQYEKLFLKEDQPLTFTNQVKRQIDLKNDKPIFTKSYRYPYVHKEEVKKQIDKMLKEGIIRPSYSPWSSPIWIVPKKADASGKAKWRLVIDYRKLNEQTIDDRYPLPNITEILDKLGRCMYFTTLDLASGFHQIEVLPEDIQKTAFSVDYGHFEYVRMPFGLKNAPSTFQRVMDNVLKELQGNICLCYMDDIIIFSTSLTEHIESLRKVFDRLQNANLKIQIDKSEFLHKEIAFLGHIVTREGVKPNPDKIKAVTEFPIPRTEKQIKSFLGLVGYYRKFINNFAEITKPMTQCLRKDRRIILDQEYIECFETCKHLLTNDPILQYPDFKQPFILTTDASNVAIGAVLSQGKIGLDKPICYASRTLTQTEQNYSTIEKELLAIVWASKYFRPYLFGQKFKIVTDHKPLTWLFSLKEPNSKLVRWRLKLEEYDYEIVYKKGTKNTNADALSRIEPEQMEINIHSNSESQDSESSHENNIPVSPSNESEDIIPTTETPINEFKRQIILQTSVNAIDLQISSKILFSDRRRFTILSQEFNDEKLIHIIKEFIPPKQLTALACDRNTFAKINSVIHSHFHTDQLNIIRAKYLRKDLEDTIDQLHMIKTIHETGHRGITENLEQIKRTHFFPKMKSLIHNYINKCETCQTSKYNRQERKLELELTETSKKPLELVHIDIFHINSKKFLTILDKFSKFGVAFPIKAANPTEIVKLLKTYMASHGKPRKLIADNGSEFISQVFKEFCLSHKISTHLTTPRNSTGNSPVERFHSTLIEIYRVIFAKDPNKDPDELMIDTIIVYNHSIHSVTNLTPMELKNGHYHPEEIFPESPPDSLNLYIRQSNKNYEKLCNLIYQKNFREKEKLINKLNEKRTKPPDLKPNEIIYSKNNRRNKLHNPYTKYIVAKNNKITVTTNNNKRIHKAKIKHLLQDK